MARIKLRIADMPCSILFSCLMLLLLLFLPAINSPAVKAGLQAERMLLL